MLSADSLVVDPTFVLPPRLALVMDLGENERSFADGAIDQMVTESRECHVTHLAADKVVDLVVAMVEVFNLDTLESKLVKMPGPASSLPTPVVLAHLRLHRVVLILQNLVAAAQRTYERLFDCSVWKWLCGPLPCESGSRRRHGQLWTRCYWRF